MIKREFISSNFDEVIKCFDKHRRNNADISSHMEKDGTWVYHIEWYEHTNEAYHHMEVLNQLEKSATKKSISDALNYAQSCIKTLIDMGVIE